MQDFSILQSLLGRLGMDVGHLNTKSKCGEFLPHFGLKLRLPFLSLRNGHPISAAIPFQLNLGTERP